ncbi:MAG TPA: LysE family transporter [Polyangiaceae bacterium]|nr:LysE family transporter [Polyangiaceae bacterium]
MGVLAVCSIALAFGFFGSVPLVGPIAIMVLSRAARRKFDEARRVAVGAAVAEGIYAAIAFWGFTTFLARHSSVVPISHAATAVLLVALGARFVSWRPMDGRDRRATRSGTVLLGFSVSALNPTLLLTWSAAVAFIYSKGLGNQPPLVAVPFGVSAAAGVGGWLVCFVALLRKYEGKVPRTAMTWAVRVMGVVLVGLGTWSGMQLAKWAHDQQGPPRPATHRQPGNLRPLTCLSWRASRRT